MTQLFEALEITATTNSSGYIPNILFDNDFDLITATGNSPSSGYSAGIVSVTAIKTGTATARVRVYTQGPSGGAPVIVGANVQVTVTVLAIRTV